MTLRRQGAAAATVSIALASVSFHTALGIDFYLESNADNEDESVQRLRAVCRTDLVSPPMSRPQNMGGDRLRRAPPS